MLKRGAAVDDLSNHVLQSFGIKAKRIAKEKSAYIISTDKGYRTIRKSFDSCDSIIFQHEIKEGLAKKGFPFTDRFYLSESCAPYVEHDNGIYTMTSVYDFKEADFSNNSKFLAVVEQVSVFHKLASRLKFSNKVYYANSHVIDTYKKNLENLNAVKKRIGIQKKLSDFDVMFLKNYYYYKEQVESTIELLEKTKIQHYLQEAKTNGTICHGILKEENILLDKKNVYIVNFSNAAVGYNLFDLSNLIKRYIKCQPDSRLCISEIIAAYSRNCPLEREEIEILYPLLLFPHKFIRICGQYYSKKRTWTPSAIANRMETVISAKEDYHEYIKSMKKI